jgi:hypothetical protein
MNIKKTLLTTLLASAMCLSPFVFSACPSMDFTGDSKVDVADFAVFAEQWMQEGVKPYSDLTRADIIAMETDMSTAAIDASNGNEFMPGSYFIYKTSEGRFGKFMVENYEPATTNHRLTLRWMTYNGNGSVYTYGSGLAINGTYLCDLDSGQQTVEETGSDWFWNMLTSTTRRVDARNSAKFKLMHRAKAPAGMTWVYINDRGVAGQECFNGFMSRCEITNAQYCQFLNAALGSGDIAISTLGGYNVIGAKGSETGDDFAGKYYYNLNGAGSSFNGAINGGAARVNYTGGSFTVDSGFENHPVTYVSWYGAMAFCNYYGYRLPTEWQWQAAADYYGDYNYGCGVTIGYGSANIFGSVHPEGTTAVGTFGYWGYGMADMAGNVWEWTSSPNGNYYFVRGGCWANHFEVCLVSSQYHRSPADREYFLGFRVCRLVF